MRRKKIKANEFLELVLAWPDEAFPRIKGLYKFIKDVAQKLRDEYGLSGAVTINPDTDFQVLFAINGVTLKYNIGVKLETYTKKGWGSASTYVWYFYNSSRSVCVRLASLDSNLQLQEKTYAIKNVANAIHGEYWRQATGTDLTKKTIEF